MEEPTVTPLKFSWQQLLLVEGSPPTPRFGHACAAVGNTLYVFGGASNEESGSQAFHNDMYTLEVGESSAKWSKVEEQKGDIPSARESHIMCVSGKELIVYGGVDSEDAEVCTPGLYVFDTETLVWSVKATTGNAPTAMSSRGVVSGNNLLVFGGVLHGEAQDTLHCLDMSTWIWQTVETSGATATPRCDHGCVLVGDRMYVACGSGGNELSYNDVFCLSIATMEWKEVTVSGTPPPCRDYVTVCNLANKHLLLFGGSISCDDMDKSFNDVYNLNLSGTPTWNRVTFEAPMPAERYSHTATMIGEKMCLFGGMNDQTDYNDAWVLKSEFPVVSYEPCTAPRTSYDLPVPIPALRRSLSAAPPKVVKPRDFDELRGTYIKRINEMFDQLSEKYLQLDTANETLSSERAAFEAEKKEHYQLYERQQQELKTMFENHRKQNDEWIERMRQEIDAERRATAEEKMTWQRANEELQKQQETFQQKSKKLDAIMKQVQGLNA
ncbi:uncharacterized protein [Dysidea avara]|uniref:uncharacterized protein n=1 Tax=Dysidea avara TaxID=196820 RepID=UPI00332FE30A